MAATLPYILLIEIVAPQLVIKYSINNSHQPDVNLTRTKVVSYIPIYLYKGNRRIPVVYIGFSNMFYRQRNRMGYY